jgi:hypothetical protein
VIVGRRLILSNAITRIDPTLYKTCIRSSPGNGYQRHTMDIDFKSGIPLWLPDPTRANRIRSPGAGGGLEGSAPASMGLGSYSREFPMPWYSRSL